MSQAIRISFLLHYLQLLWVLGTQQVSGLTQALCSSDNTGTSFAVVRSQYMSNGHCFDTCKAKYVFAIVQDQSCWCSNKAPVRTASVGACNQNCPGFPFEQCGSQSAGLFGYIALNKTLSGTRETFSAAPSNTATSSAQTLHGVVSSIVSLSAQIPSSTASITPQLSLQSSTISESSASLPHYTALNFAFIPSPVTVQEHVTPPPSVRISFATTPSPSPSPATLLSNPTLVISISTTSSTVVTPTVPTPPSSPTNPGFRGSSYSYFSSRLSATSLITVTGGLTTIPITPTAPPPTSNPVHGGPSATARMAAGWGAGIGFLFVAAIAGVGWYISPRRCKRNADTSGGKSARQFSQRLTRLIPPNGSSPEARQTVIIAPSCRQDSRLGPMAPWGHGNNSVATLKDDKDYSRRLTINN